MKVIESRKARNIAYQWQGGQWSAHLYAFASSGLIEDLQALCREIDACAVVASTKTAVREVNSLRRFVGSSAIAKIPGRYPYAAPWYFNMVEKNGECYTATDKGRTYIRMVTA